MLIEKFKRERMNSKAKHDKPRAAASINRELELLSRIFSMAVDNGLVEVNPRSKVKLLKLNNERKRILASDEEDRLMLAFNEKRAHLRPVFLIAIYTGMRRGEILSMRWADVDFASGTIYIPMSKSGKPRTVPMNAVVRDELSKLKQDAKESEFVFSNARTGVGIGDIKTGWKGLCEMAGVKDFRFHDLRRTFSSRLSHRGISPYVIRELMEHRSFLMTARYTYATEEVMTNAVESLVGKQGKVIEFNRKVG